MALMLLSVPLLLAAAAAADADIAAGSLMRARARRGEKRRGEIALARRGCGRCEPAERIWLRRAGAWRPLAVSRLISRRGAGSFEFSTVEIFLSWVLECYGTIFWVGIWWGGFVDGVIILRRETGYG